MVKVGILDNVVDPAVVAVAPAVWNAIAPAIWNVVAKSVRIAVAQTVMIVVAPAVVIAVRWAPNFTRGIAV